MLLMFRRIRSFFFVAYQRIRRQVFGTAVDEMMYKNRKNESVRAYLDNHKLPHRNWLVEILNREGIQSILEVGSGWGANLLNLIKVNPSLHLVGLDISPASIEEGRKVFETAQLSGVELLLGAAHDLSQYEDESFDLVFTDAVLLYVGPDKFDTVLKEFVRVAKRRVVLVELDDPDIERDKYAKDGWIRNYKDRLDDLFPGEEIQVHRMPKGLRPEGRWGEFGSLITILKP